MNNQLVGRILMLILNLLLITSIVFIFIDKTYVALIFMLPCTIASIIVQVDELIHPEKYEW